MSLSQPARVLMAAGLTALPGAARPQSEVPLPEHPREVLIPSLPPFARALPRPFALEDGRTAYVMPEDSLQLRGVLRFHAGSTDEPPGQVGVADLLADVMRASGSIEYPAAELDSWLMVHGADLRIEAHTEMLEVRFGCLGADWEDMLARVASVLREPAITDRALEHARRRLLAQVAGRSATPAFVADWAVAVVSYGADSPHARQPSPESLPAITTDDVATFHRERVRGEKAVIAVLGSPTDEQLLTLGRVLADPADDTEGTEDTDTRAEARSFSGFIQPAKTRVWVVDRPDALHTEVRVAAPGVRRLDPDGSELELWSRIVGQGGIAQRMGMRFPARRVVAGFHAEWDRAGAFLGTFHAPNAEVSTVLQGMLEVLQDSKTSVSEEDVDRIRGRLMNEELFAADTPTRALERSLDLVFHDYPEDFYRQRLLSWRNARPEALVEAVDRRLDLGRLVIVAVGPLELLKDELASLGPVEELKLERALAPGGSQPEEVQAMLEALGGRQAWADTAAIHAQIDIVMPNREIPSRQWSELGGPRFRAEYLIASESVILVTDAEQSVQVTSRGRANLSAEAHQAQLEAQRRGLWQVLHRLARSAGVRVRLDENHSLAIQDDQGLDVLLELGEDHLPRRLVERHGADIIAREFSEWSTEGPLAYPTRIVSAGGEFEWRIGAFEGLSEFSPLLLETTE